MNSRTRIDQITGGKASNISPRDIGTASRLFPIFPLSIRLELLTSAAREPFAKTRPLAQLFQSEALHFFGRLCARDLPHIDQLASQIVELQNMGRGKKVRPS